MDPGQGEGKREKARQGGQGGQNISKNLNRFIAAHHSLYSQIENQDRQLRSWQFLAASSNSRSLVVGRSVRRSVGRSGDFVKKLPLEYQIVTKTYLKPTYLPT